MGAVAILMLSAQPPAERAGLSGLPVALGKSPSLPSPAPRTLPGPNLHRPRVQGSPRGALGTVGAATGSVKPALTGVLVSPWYPGLARSGANVGGFLVGAPWSAVQPTSNGSLNTSAIDSMIAAARQAHQRVRLRIGAGIEAPAWAKALGGPPVAVSDPQSGTAGTVGRFWTPAFGAAYSRLQLLLAQRYDGNPTVAEVVVDRCTTVFPEPFLRNADSPATIANLLAAGYSVSADQACQEQEIDAAAVWRSTRSGLAFNPYDSVAPNGVVTADEAFTEQMMSYCRTVLGARCVLENDSIRWPALGFDYARMYQRMQGMGGDISFETALVPRVGDVVRTVRWARSTGASAVQIAAQMPVALTALVSAFG